MALTVSLDEIVAGGNALLTIKPHWKRVRLGDIGEVLNGFAFKAELFTRDSGMPIIRIRDVGRAASETFYCGDFDERYVVTAGELLVGMDGDFNCARWRGPRSLLNQRVCKITVDETLYLPRFLDYVLPGYLKAINDATSSVTVKHLSSRTIQDIPLPLPPMDEQRKIVAELEKQFSRLDEAVANLHRVKVNLKRYKAAVLKAAVEGRLVETEASIARREGRTYEAGEQLLQRVAEVRKSLAKGKRVSSSAADDVGQLVCPEGWAWSTCDAAIQAIDAGASFKCEERPPVGDEVGVLKVSALTWGVYDESESKTCKDTARIEEKFLVRDGDFLFSRANTIELVGACVIVGKTTKRLMLSDKTLRFTVSKGVLPEWLQICLRCKFGRDEIERLATGNQESMRNIGQERIRQIRMPFPPHAEQTRIVAEVDRRLSVIREIEGEVDTNLQRAQALRQATLAKAFSGECA